MIDDKIIDVLKRGELVIIPTDTVYGISADATKRETAKLVNDAKGRKERKPLNILVSDDGMLQKYVKKITPLEREIINKLTPGKITILLSKNDLISDEITNNSPFIAIRIPDNEWLRNLISKFGRPIVSTSANITGSDVVASLDNLEEELKKHISFIYDIGKLQTTPSTLIKVENEKIHILRDGIMKEKLEKEFKDYLEEQ